MNPVEERFRKRYGVHDEFILCAGRKDRTKNTHLLIEYFKEYKRRKKRNVKLILIGKGSVDKEVGGNKDIIDIGFLPAEELEDAMAAACVVCQPSTNESFSRVIMEAWLCQTPVLVSGDCAVTAQHCRTSNGGLYYRSYFEFEECIEYFMDNRDVSNILAENGRQYVLENFKWSTIVDRFKNEVLANLR